MRSAKARIHRGKLGGVYFLSTALSIPRVLAARPRLSQSNMSNKISRYALASGPEPTWNQVKSGSSAKAVEPPPRGGWREILASLGEFSGEGGGKLGFGA
jgi:hypothetical protein